MTAHVDELMSRKVVTVNVESTAFEAARDMLDHDIGCVLVTDGRKILGVVTKSDIIREAVLRRLDPQKLNVETVMSKPAITIDSSKSLAEASEMMSKHNITKLPVVEKGDLVGIITSSDLVRKIRPKKLAKDMI
jgi:CBS domain-containing protein